MPDNFFIHNHLLQGARYSESPNQSERPAATDIDLLIIHNISLPPGEYGTGCIDQLFCNELIIQQHPYFSQLENLKVSAHLLIERSGAMTQFVPFNAKAWHAGDSVYEGRSGCNDFSIGIELEGSDFEAFADVQYRMLTVVTKLLLAEYPCLNPDRIVGHSDVAPDRKTDPGPYFDWSRYQHSLAETNSPES